MAASGEVRPKNRERQRGALILVDKVMGGTELKGYPGQVLGSLSHRERPRAGGGVVHLNPVLADRFEDDEVAHIPVRDGGQPELAEVIDFKPEGTAGKLKLARNRNQGSERHSIERNWKSTT